MKKILFRLMLCVAVLGAGQTVSAQGFFKSLDKGLDQISKVADKVSETTGATDDGTDSIPNKIKEEELKTSYTCQKVYVTDDNGNRVKNADGTDKFVVQLVDQNGNPVSQEAVTERVKKINNAILLIAGKAAAGAGIGALTGGGKGALIGLAAGIGLSVPDIITIVKLKKDANKQKKAMELYNKSFDEEGNPLTAKVDSKVLKELNISDDNAVSKTTAQIEKEMKADTYKDIPSNESIDALLSAAAKVSSL